MNYLKNTTIGNVLKRTAITYGRNTIDHEFVNTKRDAAIPILAAKLDELNIPYNLEGLKLTVQIADLQNASQYENFVDFANRVHP